MYKVTLVQYLFFAVLLFIRALANKITFVAKPLLQVADIAVLSVKHQLQW